METRIALCQLNPLAEKPEENLEVIDEILQKYAKKKVSLFIFPEDFLFGILRDKNKIIKAAKNFDVWTKRLSILAKKYQVDLVPGSFPHFRDKKVYNTTVYINKHGEIINQYSKSNLWLSERETYTASTIMPKVFNSVLGKTVQIICWDMMKPRLFEEAVKQDAQWIINVSLWSTNQSRDLAKKRGKTKNKYANSLSRSERLNALIETRSHEYAIGLIFCNIGGVHKYVAMDGLLQHARSAGCTQIIAPLDGIRKTVTDKKEHIFVCDVPDIRTHISDHEILWGRREDITNNYPFLENPNDIPLHLR